MSFDKRDTHGETPASYTATDLHCAVVTCKAILSEEPLQCEECLALLCEEHAISHGTYHYCPGCEEKMKAAITVAAMELARLQGLLIDGKVTADEAGQSLVDIGNRLADWNAA